MEGVRGKKGGRGRTEGGRERKEKSPPSLRH